MSNVKKWRAYLIVLSDLGSQGKREDTAGEAVKNILEDNNFVVNTKIIIPDDFDSLSTILKEETHPDHVESDVIFTIGGTGLSPRDITPQATKAILDVEIPGLTELMRIKGYVLSSFKSILYLGRCVFIRFASVNNASTSFLTTIHSRSAIILTNDIVFARWCFLLWK